MNNVTGRAAHQLRRAHCDDPRHEQSVIQAGYIGYFNGFDSVMAKVSVLHLRKEVVH